VLLALFALVLVGCVALIPLGLPGTWLMLVAAIGANLLPGPRLVGASTLIAVALVALVGEVLEYTVSARYTTRYGGSRRAGWGAIAGGFVGAVIGVPVPIVGSVVGAFVGAFAGAYLAERSRETAEGRVAHGPAARVATGALVGRAVAAALKTGCGILIAVWLLLAAAA
jgi:uncharacterized protein YqgC (DUF456 family)